MNNIIVSGQDILNAVDSGKLLGSRVSPRTPLENSQGTSRNPAGGDGIAAPLQQSHTRCRPSDPVMGSHYQRCSTWYLYLYSSTTRVQIPGTCTCTCTWYLGTCTTQRLSSRTSVTTHVTTCRTGFTTRAANKHLHRFNYFSITLLNHIPFWQFLWCNTLPKWICNTTVRTTLLKNVQMFKYSLSKTTCVNMLIITVT